MHLIVTTSFGCDYPVSWRRFGSVLAGIQFTHGRESPGGNAIALVEVDGPVPAEVVERVKRIPHVQRVQPLRF